MKFPVSFSLELTGPTRVASIRVSSSPHERTSNSPPPETRRPPGSAKRAGGSSAASSVRRNVPQCIVMHGGLARAGDVTRAIRHHRVVGVHVDCLHEPPRVVSADRKHDEIERTGLLADRAELRMQRSVAREIHPRAVRDDRPAAPQRVTAIAHAARAEVLRRNTRRRKLWSLHRAATNPAR